MDCRCGLPSHRLCDTADTNVTISRALDGWQSGNHPEVLPSEDLTFGVHLIAVETSLSHDSGGDCHCLTGNRQHKLSRKHSPSAQSGKHEDGVFD
jgi:hypothetical protein